ncbi:coiled-coil domain-containing protein 93-like [Rhopilema esculentum]|uniref:coiled-coil domain-containing protein 93-like n=1 Tax=Rhopilema esculentum TaxID=499914 RepID=UPI0031D56A6D|eukprot:gene13007-3775_t
MDGKIETREDEEQRVKFDETVELLLAAGYFRARIKGLSPFDKIVGGMVWCITTCDFDVDVDLLFQENSTIGQKIALTEKIVAVLPKMKCPHPIEPHQIQGLDFIHIFPVIQWLVKRAIATREELGDKIRAFSIMKFHKHHTMPQDIEKLDKVRQSTSAVRAVQDTYKPKRVLKKPENLTHADEETQVQSTLLEYGKRYGLSKSSKSEKEEKMQEKAAKAGLLTDKASQENTDSEEFLEQQRKLEMLLEGMSGADMKESLSSHLVGSIVGLQSDEIAKMAEEYASRQAGLQQTGSQKSRKIDIKQMHERQVAAINKSIELAKNKLEKVQKDWEEAKSNLEDAKKSYDEKCEAQKATEDALIELEKEEQGQNKVILDKLRGLVAMNENLKKQEQEFRAHCKEEMIRLQEAIEKLKEESALDSMEDSERFKTVLEQLEKDKNKLQKIRLLAAKRNREIASLQWKMDDVPARAELNQYQQRFIALYNQVAATHKETKQFYTLYNTLDDTKLYLEKEVNLLTSIHDNFDQALKSSSSSKDQFLDQMENILAGVLKNKDTVEKRKRNEKIKRDTFNDQYLQIVEQERLYFKSVKEFKEECRKSEMIQSKMAAKRD